MIAPSATVDVRAANRIKIRASMMSHADVNAPQCMIGWVAGLCCVIHLEVRFLHTIGWSRWLVIWYLTISRCAEILKESRLCAAPVNLNGALQV